jgi:hypothetical protein
MEMAMKLYSRSLLASLLLAAGFANAAVVITPITLTTTEDGSAVQYQVLLDVTPDPGEQATVTPASGDATEGSVSGPLIFTTANWDVPQFVTVTPGASGDGNDGDVAYTITNAVASNVGGGEYDGVVAADVNVTNANIEGVATIVVDPSSGFWVLEGGVGQVITVEAVGAPTNDITVDLTNNTPAEVSISAASVVLTAGNGYSTTFTVTALDDVIVDGDIAFSITTDPALSIDLAYDGINPFDVNGFAQDDDVLAPPAPATPLPTLSQWSQILLLLLLAGVAVYNLRRRV